VFRRYKSRRKKANMVAYRLANVSYPKRKACDSTQRANRRIAEEPDEDNMEEIETDNIVPGRTRGKTIDFKKANEELGDDDDDDDDEDFVDPDDQMKD